MKTSLGRSLGRAGCAGVLALAMALVATGCGGGGAAQSTGSEGGSSLKVTVYPGSLISFPAHVAEAKGFFKKHGLNVGLVEVAGGPNATAAVISGSADIQLNSTDNNMLARQKGQDMVAVAGNTTHQIFSVIVNNSVPTPNLSQGFPAAIRDLKGLKLGVVQRGSSSELVMRDLLQGAGLDPDKDVTFVAVGTPPTALPALQKNRIDGYLAFEPMQTQAVEIQKFAKIVLDLRGSLPPALHLLDWEYNQWAALRANVEKKRDAFNRFQAAMKETYAYMEDPANFNSLVDIGLKSITNDRKVVTTMLKHNLDTFGYKIVPPGIKNTSDFLLQFHQMSKPVTYDEYVDKGAR